MLIEILKPIAGLGDFVEGSHRQFVLDAGMRVEVRDDVAAQWIAAGIARVEEPMTVAREAAVPAKPERAVQPHPQPRPRRKERR